MGESDDFPTDLERPANTDCPIYLEAQGKTWNPYFKVTKELCAKCPYYLKQCNGKTFGEVKGGDNGNS